MQLKYQTCKYNFDHDTSRVTVINAAGEVVKQFSLDFTYNKMLITTMFIVHGWGLISHSYNHMLWFDLDTGKNIGQYKINNIVKSKSELDMPRINDLTISDPEPICFTLRPLTPTIDDYDEIRLSCLTGINKVKDEYTTRCLHTVGNDLYAQFANFNNLTDYIFAKIDHQGRVLYSFPVLESYRYQYTIPNDFTINPSDLTLTVTATVQNDFINRVFKEKYDITNGSRLIITY
jgi:hypothetical protein